MSSKATARRRPEHPPHEPEHEETPEMMFTAATLDRFPDELDLDLRTTDQLADDDDALADLAREVVYGLPSRPGVRR